MKQRSSAGTTAAGGLRAMALPVGHVVEVLRELRQVGALLLVLLFCPKQNLRNLKKGSRLGGAGPAGCPGTSSGGSPGRDSLLRAPPTRTSIL